MAGKAVLLIFFFCLPQLLIAFAIYLFKDLYDPVSGVSKLDNLYLISCFQKETNKNLEHDKFSVHTDSTEEENREVIKAAYADLISDNVMPAQSYKEMTDEEYQKTFRDKNSFFQNQFDDQGFKHSPTNSSRTSANMFRISAP